MCVSSQASKKVSKIISKAKSKMEIAAMAVLRVILFLIDALSSSGDHLRLGAQI